MLHVCLNKYVSTNELHIYVCQFELFNVSFLYFLVGGKFLYSVMLASVVEQHKPAISRHVLLPS